MSDITWADLDAANVADGHYRKNLKPEFYRAALEAEAQSFIDRNQAIEDWQNCPEWQARKRELYRAWLAAEERWSDCRGAVNILYLHWQKLIMQSNDPCSCQPDRDSVCNSCAARARLNDPHYTPTEKDLLHENGFPY